MEANALPSTAPAVPVPAPTVLPELSADIVHAHIMRCHRLGSRVDAKKLYWLTVLYEKDWARELVGSGISHYIQVNLNASRSESDEIVTVIKSRRRLPHTFEAFQLGTISWNTHKAIASVRKASAKTEEQWIEFAHTHTVDQLREAARDANARGRGSPRTDRAASSTGPSRCASPCRGPSERWSSRRSGRRPWRWWSPGR